MDEPRDDMSREQANRDLALDAVERAESWLGRDEPDPGTVAFGHAWATVALVYATIAYRTKTGETP